MYDYDLKSLARYWLEANCGCGETHIHSIDQLAADTGADKSLRALADDMTCGACGNHPAALYLSNYNPRDREQRKRGDRWKLYNPMRRPPALPPVYAPPAGFGYA